MDRSDGEEKRAKADAASTAAATPHHRAGSRSLAGDEQENLDPAAPIRDGSERIGEGGDAIAPRIDGEGVDADDDAVPDSQATLGASSEDHPLGAMATRPAPSPDEIGDPDDVFAGILPTQAAAPEPEDEETAKLRERVLSETGRRLSAGWRASVETSMKKKRVRFFSPDGKRFGCAKDVVNFAETQPPGVVGDETATTRNLAAAMRDAVQPGGGEEREEETLHPPGAPPGPRDGDEREAAQSPPDAIDARGDVDSDDAGSRRDVAPTQAAPVEVIEQVEQVEQVSDDSFDVKERKDGAVDADERAARSPPPSPDDGLTAFERMRMANIARNERVMATLNIPSGIPVAFAPALATTRECKNKNATPGFDDDPSLKGTVQRWPTSQTPPAGDPAEDPPIVVVDARPGDAAVRYLRGRLLASSGDAAPREGALDFCPELREHQRHLADILTDTITGGQNNSVLLVGARGSGKTLVLDSALRQLREAHGDGVLPVRLNGMLHADERVAMREIAEQLCLGFKAEELEFSRAAGFAENVAFMREMLRVLENGRRGVVFVLEEFDLFAHRPKQTLLYAVMDLLQQTQVQAAVVGVTCRHDAAELLEKRVKSRFSSRRILLAPPVGRMRAATLVRHALSLPLPPPPPPPPVDGGEYGGEERRGGAAASPTGIEPTLVYPPDPGFAARWNEAVDAAVAQVGVDHTLRAYEALECTPRAASDLALFALACMDRDKGVIMAKDIMVASQRLLGDTYVRALSGVSALELCMVVAMSRLHRFRRKAVFNFNHVEDELKNMAANDFLGDAGRARAPTLSRAFEGLLAMGLVEAQSGGVGAGLGGAVTLRRGRGHGGHKHWREIQLLLTDEEVATAVGKHPNKPAGLSELLTHEGVRQTTAGC